MKAKKGYTLYIVLLVLVLGIIYTACKDITPKQERITNDIELKLSR